MTLFEIEELFTEIIELRKFNPRCKPVQFIRMKEFFTKNKLVFLFELEERFSNLIEPRKQASSAVSSLVKLPESKDESLKVENIHLTGYIIVRKKN